MFNIFKFLNLKKKDEEKSEKKGAKQELKVHEEKKEDYEKEIEKNVAIHVMPERFRIVAGKRDSAKTAGTLIIGGGILLLIVVLALLYFYLFGGRQLKPGPIATSTGDGVEEGANGTGTPGEPAKQPEIKLTPPPETATTSPVTPTEGEATSTVTSPEEVNGQISFTPGADQDEDGLTDKEEAVFGSDLNNIDSDNDGYNDLGEVNNLYNPVGQEKLESSPSVKNYSNATYKYSLLYPVSWSLNKIGGDDSVIIQSGDNHFIQIIVQPNSKKESIEDWYKAQFGTEELLREIFTRDGWQGIKSDNDLILYLTDSNKEYLYTITYNLGENTVLEYKNIFEMLVKSFVIKG